MSKGQMNDMFRQMEELFSKVDKLTIEINKNDNNKNATSYKTTVIDINIAVTVTDYLYYPDENGNFNVQKNILYMVII